ncbi:MAG: hypothetical protein M1150_01925 [Patescibacteria group bacterium]|nr:hypothetical protein [Patescibacteria group bacterium]
MSISLPTGGTRRYRLPLLIATVLLVAVGGGVFAFLFWRDTSPSFEKSTYTTASPRTVAVSSSLEFDFQQPTMRPGTVTQVKIIPTSVVTDTSGDLSVSVFPSTAATVGLSKWNTEGKYWVVPISAKDQRVTKEITLEATLKKNGNRVAFSKSQPIPLEVAITGHTVGPDGRHLDVDGWIKVSSGDGGLGKVAEVEDTKVQGGEFTAMTLPGMVRFSPAIEGYHVYNTAWKQYYSSEPRRISVMLWPSDQPPPPARGEDIVDGGWSEDDPWENIAKAYNAQGVSATRDELAAEATLEKVDLDGSFGVNYARSEDRNSLFSGERSYARQSGTLVVFRGVPTLFDDKCLNIIVPVTPTVPTFLKIVKFTDENGNGQFLPRGDWQFRVRTTSPDFGFDQFLVTDVRGEIIFPIPPGWFTNSSRIELEVSEDPGAFGYEAVFTGRFRKVELVPGITEQVEFFNRKLLPPGPPPPPPPPGPTPTSPPSPTPTSPPGPGPTPTSPPGPTPTSPPGPTQTPVPPTQTPPGPTQTPVPPTETPVPPTQTPINMIGPTPSAILSTPVIPNPSPTAVFVPAPTPTNPPSGRPTMTPAPPPPGPTNTPLRH